MTKIQPPPVGDWKSAMRRAVLWRLQHHGPATSRELAAAMGFKPDTLSARLNELALLNLIARDGLVGCGPGRPCIRWKLKVLSREIPAS